MAECHRILPIEGHRPRPDRHPVCAMTGARATVHAGQTGGAFSGAGTMSCMSAVEHLAVALVVSAVPGGLAALLWFILKTHFGRNRITLWDLLDLIVVESLIFLLFILVVPLPW